MSFGLRSILKIKLSCQEVVTENILQEILQSILGCEGAETQTCDYGDSYFVLKLPIPP